MTRHRNAVITLLPLAQKIFFCLLIFLFSFPFLGEADPGPTQPSEPPSPPTFFGETEKGERRTGEAIWLAHRELWQKRDFKRSLEELEKLYQWKLNQGVRNHYTYSLALVRESQVLALQERSPTVLALLNYAEKMAPDLSQVVRVKAQWIWKENFPSKENIGQAIQAWVRAFYLSFVNLEEALPRLANFLLLLFLSFIGVFIIFSLALIFKYYPFLAHHWQHLLGSGHGFRIAVIIPGLLLTIPFAFSLGWMWVFIFWFAIFALYASRTDRIVMITFLVLLCFWPACLRLYASILASFAGNGNMELVRANNGVYEPELYRKVLALTKNKAADADLWHTLALLEKKMGRYGEAEKSLLKYGELEPYSAAFYNNLGNIYLVTNRLEMAIQSYQKAIKLNPGQAEIYYNLGQAYLLNLQLGEAEMQFRQARQFAPQLISYYTSISTKHAQRLVIDLPVEKLRLFKRILAPSPERDEMAEAIWEVLFGKIPLKYGEIGLGFVLLIFIFGQKYWGGGISIKKCVRCGRRICSRCLRTMVIGQQCSQCLHTFSNYNLGDPKLGQLKKLEVAAYQKRRHFWAKFLSHLFPGAGHLYLGHSWEGIFYLFILFFVSSKVIFGPGWIPDPWPGEATHDLSTVTITMVIIIAFYLFVQYRLLGISLSKRRSFFGND